MKGADRDRLGGGPGVESLSAFGQVVFWIKANLLRRPWFERRANRLLQRWAMPARRLNVLMLHSGRCGSTILGNMLSQHSAIRWASEIYGNFPVRYPGWWGRPDAAEEILRTSMHVRRSPIYGFEVNFLPHHQLRPAWLNQSLESFVPMVESFGATRFVVLRRRNYLRWAISVETARQSRVWHANQELQRPYRVRLNCGAWLDAGLTHPLTEAFRIMDEAHEATTRLLPPDRTLQLSYEEHVEQDPQRAYREVCRLLELKPESPVATLKRRNRFPTSESVANWEEVRAHLAQTKYASML